MKNGTKVGLVREALRISKTKMANDLKVVPSYVSMVERGQREPSETFLKLLKNVYSVSEKWWETQEGEIFEIKESEPDTVATLALKDLFDKLEKLSYADQLRWLAQAEESIQEYLRKEEKQKR